MAASMEQQEQRQWTLHDLEQEEEEEEEVDEQEAALERRKFLAHNNKDMSILVTGVVESSSSSSSDSSADGNGSEHSNGVFLTVANAPDGSLVQKEEGHEENGSVGDGENGNHFKNGEADCEAVGLGIVAEFAEAATNGEAVTGAAAGLQKNSIYFDKQQGNEVKGHNGVQNGDRAGSVLPTNHGEREFGVQVEGAVIPNTNNLCNGVNSQFMKIVDDKVPSSSALSHLHNSSDKQATSVMDLDDGGTSTKEVPNIISEIDHQLKDYDVEAVLAKQETHDLFCPNCNSCITKRVILKKRKRTHNLENKSKRDKLDTVVSSKPVDSFTQEANHGDQENVTPEIVSSQEQPDGNHDPEREPEVFRCLSCLSFFIPSGKCFNLFRNSGGAHEQGTAQNSSSIPASNLENPSNAPISNANWPFSLFTSNKGKITSQQGDSSLGHSRTGPARQHHSTPITSNMLTSSGTGGQEGSLAVTDTIKNVKPMPNTVHGREGLNPLNSSTMESIKTEQRTENDIKSNVASGNEPLANQKGLDSLFQNDLASIQASTKSSGDVKAKEGEKMNDSADIIKTETDRDISSVSFSNENVPKHDSASLAAAATAEILVNAREPTEGAILKPYEGKPEFPVPTTVESPILDKSPIDVNKTTETVQESYSSLRQGTLSPAQSFGSAVLASDEASNKLGAGIDAMIPSKIDSTLNGKVRKDIEEEIYPSNRKENKGRGDVIVVVEGEAVESTTSLMADNVPVEGAIMTDSHTQTCIGEPTAETGEPKEWEILKSIVYGGLVESITSLGIVSSAVSSGAAPLKIIALGLANLVGGVFILGHNLGELRNDHSRGGQQQTNDQYQALLGRRENFLLHVVVAIVSFLIFGSVPIVIYGILINKNYNAELKLVVVVAASVLCIILLVIGKVYTKRPPKSYIKIVSYYVTLAIASSGVCYIGGNLIKDLLEKFNHSDSGFVITMPISDTEPAWMSH